MSNASLGGGIWLFYRLDYYGSPAASFPSYQSRDSQSIEHFLQIGHPHGYFVASRFALPRPPLFHLLRLFLLPWPLLHLMRTAEWYLTRTSPSYKKSSV